MHQFVSDLQELLENYRNSERAEGMTAYMRNKFSFIGVNAAQRRTLFKEYIKKNGLTDYADLQQVIEEFWELEERDFQYIGMEVTELLKKKWQPEIVELLEWMILQKSWWDTTDFIDSHLIGLYFQKYPQHCEQAIEKWMDSGNIWLQRTCLIFQLQYKEKTNTTILFDCCRRLAHEDEFFIRKGIGWALRQYARIDSKAVLDFVDKTPLKPLSRKEALKHLVK
jgi:3-methyladenine DNA glycosylase AlkD